MSVRVLAAVFDHSAATANDRLVLLAIADEADDDGTNAYPSVATIAKKVRLPQRTVLRCLERLSSLGELTVIRPTQPGRGRFNRYVVHVPKHDTLTPEQSGHKGATNPRNGDGELALTSDGAPHPRRSTRDASNFSRFYTAFPLKREPQAAKRAWDKALLVVGGDAERLITAAERYRDDPNRSPKFTKYPATWLNKGCWADEVPAETAPPVPTFAERRAAEERERVLSRAAAEAAALEAER